MYDRNIDHLCDDLRPLCQEWIDKCTAQSIRVIITNTYRSCEEQNEDYASGRTVSGPIITNAKGGQSKHNCTTPDGTPAARAFDFAIYGSDETLNWDVASPAWLTAVAIGKELGLVWGGDWESIKDSDHFELPN